MKKRIFGVLTTLVMTTIVILCLAMTTIYYNFYKTQSENDLKAVANFFVKADNDHDALNKDLIKDFPYEIRITVIDRDGNVVFDTKKNMTFENHLNREEVQEAFKTGSGESTRKSETLGKNAYYYALKYNNDSVIRFSRQLNSITSIFISILPFIILVASIVVIISTIIASMLSKSIIKPVNTLVEKIDIFAKRDDEDIMDTTYEELRPVARTVKELTGAVDDYISQLKEEKATINLITDNMVEGMILLDNKLNILSVNRSAIEILNNEFVLDNTKNILHLTRNNEIISIIEKVKNKEISSGNIVVNTKNQKCHKVFVNQAYGKENSYGIIVLLVDVTESIRVEEIRRDFASNVSHELKTPLTTIKGFGEMLSAGIISEKEDVSRYGSTIYRESERLLLLINDIIRLSEIEEISNVAERTPVKLLDCALEAKNILAKVASDKDVTVTVTGDNCIVNGNKSYLNELMLNLTDNAIKYNNPGGKVDISIEDMKDTARVIIRDNGIGISKKHQDRIFERFYRVDKSRSKLTGGTGLGLSIVKHIILYHGGTIELKSDEGLGTEITVYLPISNL